MFVRILYRIISKWPSVIIHSVHKRTEWSDIEFLYDAGVWPTNIITVLRRCSRTADLWPAVFLQAIRSNMSPRCLSEIVDIGVGASETINQSLYLSGIVSKLSNGAIKSRYFTLLMIRRPFSSRAAAPRLAEIGRDCNESATSNITLRVCSVTGVTCCDVRARIKHACVTRASSRVVYEDRLFIVVESAL